MSGYARHTTNTKEVDDQASDVLTWTWALTHGVQAGYYELPEGGRRYWCALRANPTARYVDGTLLGALRRLRATKEGGE